MALGPLCDMEMIYQRILWPLGRVSGVAGSTKENTVETAVTTCGDTNITDGDAVETLQNTIEDADFTAQI